MKMFSDNLNDMSQRPLVVLGNLERLSNAGEGLGRLISENHLTPLLSLLSLWCKRYSLISEEKMGRSKKGVAILDEPQPREMECGPCRDGGAERNRPRTEA